MQHQGLIEVITKAPPFRTLVEGIHSQSPQMVYGLSGSQQSLLLAALVQETGMSLIFITPGVEEARGIAADLATFLPAEAVGYLPPAEMLPYEIIAKSLELTAQRLSVLEGLFCGHLRYLAVPANAVTQPLIQPADWARGVIALREGDRIGWEQLIARLLALGYQRAELVEVPGQVSIRGGIIDIFTLSASSPVRIELFGEEIDSIRTFDPESQRSRARLEQLRILPARELVLTTDVLERGRASLTREYHTQLKRLERQEREEAAQHLAAKMEKYLEELAAGCWGEGLEQFRQHFYPRGASIFEYFNRPPLIVLDDPGRIREAITQAAAERADLFSQLLESGAALPSQVDGIGDYAGLINLVEKYPVLCLTLLAKQLPGLNPRNVMGLTAKTMHSFMGKTALLAEEIKNWRQAKDSIVLFAGNDERAQVLKDALWDQGIEAPVIQDLSGPVYPGQVVIARGSLQRGFELPQWKLVVIGDGEVFGGQRKPRSRRSFKEGAKIAAFTDLKVGDYVVHVQHGIGRYLGIEKLEVSGVQKDYLLVQYSGEDRLYVPTDQVYLIQKYIGAEGHLPRLSRLGGSDWARAKKKVKDSIRVMAEELLALYAAREALPGHQFPPDTIWQREFEAAFPYSETPDQVRAISEVKADMEMKKPMDRLLCGDVGYGKTEVALRAAFKCIMDGKQVAVLVPTTILAQQHFRTFQERISSFPVTVAVLSRFRTHREQEKTIEDLKGGKVDVIIGTHRLLSGDIRFKDLGLVIVDEEQRFGVAHKEKLKALCKNVDVVTLTATPIPRTLHMAMAGARDMSLIETPPEDRYPVQTYVVEFSQELVREAIRREIARGGQVFFVHNRIQDMDMIAGKLQKMLPDARLAVAHGQMREEMLEQVMLDFLEGHYDVLISTSIVENGLDIANVNTLIVDEADHLGLSQLYQLRGRVGRSNRLAYAYFTYRKEKVLSETAEKRLAAIREFTEFGSGFKIAMRDLEIRGAGNILGPEQHGHMLALGFDLYCRLLEEAVGELKERDGGVAAPASQPEGPAFELNVDAYINDDYIDHNGLKMELYQRLLEAESAADVEALEEEISDRFGMPPEAVNHLFTLARLRCLAKEVHVVRVEHLKGEVRLVFGPHHGLKGEKLMQLAGNFARRLTFYASGGLTIAVRVAGLGENEILKLLESIFRRIIVLAPPRTG